MKRCLCCCEWSVAVVNGALQCVAVYDTLQCVAVNEVLLCVVAGALLCVAVN